MGALSHIFRQFHGNFRLVKPGAAVKFAAANDS